EGSLERLLHHGCDVPGVLVPVQVERGPEPDVRPPGGAAGDHAGGDRQQDRPQRDELVAVDEHQGPEEHEDRQDTDGDREGARHMILNENIPVECRGAPASWARATPTERVDSRWESVTSRRSSCAPALASVRRAAGRSTSVMSPVAKSDRSAHWR